MNGIRGNTGLCSDARPPLALIILRRSFLFLLLAFALVASAVATNPVTATSVLTDIRQIRQLTPDEVAIAPAVHIHGVVTYYDPVGPNLFVQDGTAGVWVEIPRNIKTPLIPGQLIEIDGIVAQGFTPYIAKATWKVLGHAPMPKPLVVTYADVANSSDDSQWVEMQGIVRSFVLEADYKVLVIDVASPGGSFKVRIPNYDHPLPTELVDANVQFHGVCGTAFNRQGQLITMHLFVPSLDYSRIIDPAPREPFAVPSRQIASLGRFSVQGGVLHRVKVQGFVTARTSEIGFYIKDATGGLYVETTDDLRRLKPGDEIEAVGFPATGGYTPVLRSASFRPTGQHEVVTPSRVTVRDALFGKYDAQLVEIEGTFRSERPDSSNGRVLTLESQNIPFSAAIDKTLLSLQWPSPESGSRLRLTGICSIKTDENGNPAEFRIILRTPADVLLLAQPPWFTTDRLLSILGGVGGLMLAALVWVAILRRRTQQQTAIIRKQLESEAALERRHRRLVENAPYGIASVDEQQKLLDANPAFRNIAGLESDEDLAPFKLRDALRFSPEANAELERVLQGKQSFQHLEMICTRRDSTKITLNVSGRVVYDETRHANTLEIILEDITQKQHLEQQLLQAYKLEAVGRLAGGIAHDFNNLLIIIQGYAAMLSSTATDTEEGRKLQAIVEAAKRASVLTRQLLAYSRKQVLEPKVLEIDPLLQNLDKMLRRLIREDIEFCTRFHGNGARVKVDPNQIEQVLINLAVNARDAMPGGGRLTIETTQVLIDEDEAALLSITTGEYVLISVKDTGTGMDRRTREHIFEPFFTTKELGKGTGLGLSMVYGIVKQSGGSIRVDSEPRKGTTFRLYLPAVTEPVTGENKPLESALPKGAGTILIVEDEAEVRRLLSETLTALGYKTLQASNGEEALQIARTNKNVDLAICDMIMPTMSGNEVRERLQTMCPGLSVLLISGYSEVIPEDSKFLNDRTQFLQKPFDPKTLGQKVKEILAAHVS